MIPRIATPPWSSCSSPPSARPDSPLLMIRRDVPHLGAVARSRCGRRSSPINYFFEKSDFQSFFRLVIVRIREFAFSKDAAWPQMELSRAT